jgi:hypothetical protein
VSSTAVHKYSVDLDEVRRLAVTIDGLALTLEVFQEFPIYKKGTDTTSLPNGTMHSVEECIGIAGMTVDDWAEWVMDQNHGPDWREQEAS